MKLKLKINRRARSAEVPANLTLMELLRSLGFWSVRHGCETGDCGHCTVSLDGRAVYACRKLAAQAHEREVETYEAFGDSDVFRPLKEVFMEYGDIECTYCLSGFMMAAKALLDRNPEPTEEEILDALSGVICYCSEEPYPVDEVTNAVRKMRGKL